MTEQNNTVGWKPHTSVRERTKAKMYMVANDGFLAAAKRLMERGEITEDRYIEMSKRCQDLENEERR